GLEELDAEVADHPAQGDGDAGDGGVGTFVPQGLEEAAFLQGHADEDAPAAAQEGPGEEVTGLAAEGFPGAVQADFVPPASEDGGGVATVAISLDFLVISAPVVVVAPVAEVLQEAGALAVEHEVEVPAVEFGDVDEGDAADHEHATEEEQAC